MRVRPRRSANDLISAVAAGDHDHVLPGHLDHRHRVVERGLRNVEPAGRQALALALGVLGELEREPDAVPGEDPLFDPDMKRQRLGIGEGVDAHELELVRRGGSDHER